MRFLSWQSGLAVSPHRHREPPKGVEDARLSTDFGGVAIQGNSGALVLLDHRVALRAPRDDGSGYPAWELRLPGKLATNH